MEGDFLSCRSLSTATTGEIFKMVVLFFSEEGLNWYQCFSVCTDVAPAELGAVQGFVPE
jgi:hypothetical protein